MKIAAYHRYGGADVVTIEDAATPVPKEHEVLVRVRAAVVTSADVAARSGRPIFSRLFFGILGPRLTVLGTEFAGDVEAVGSGVTRFSVGDAIVGATGARFGAHVEYLCISEDAAIAIKATNVDHTEAIAIVEGALTALPFLRDVAHLRAGQTILVNGASGSVGSAAVQLARHLGANVVAVCSAANAELVRSIGAHEVIDYAETDFTTGAPRYDVIFDAVGKSSFGRSRAALTPGGIYLSTVPGLPILLQMAWTRRSRGKRAAIAFTGLRPAVAKVPDLVHLAGLIESGALVAVVHERYPFARVAEAHAAVDTGHKRGAAVLTL